jgi:hypothetical protein
MFMILRELEPVLAKWAKTKIEHYSWPVPSALESFSDALNVEHQGSVPNEIHVHTWL